MAPLDQHGVPLHVLVWMITAALLVATLVFLTIPLAFGLLSAPFISHDSLGMPVEPAWAGYIAQYGSPFLIAGVIGSLLGRVKGFRPSHGVIAGVLSALVCCVVQYVRGVMNGVPPGLVEVLFGTSIIGFNIIPVMAFFAARSARKQIES